MERYVPAAGIGALNRFYDLGIAAVMREPTWRPLLVREVSATKPTVVVDVGCGTGTLTTKLVADGRQVIGVDGDPGILTQAQRKKHADRVAWRVGLSDHLPLADGIADVVVMSLLLHHLTTRLKQLSLSEAHRVLRPGGRLLVADWGAAHDPMMRAGYLGLQLLDGFENTADNVRGLVPGFIESAGFTTPERLQRIRTVFGSFEVLSSAKSTSAALTSGP
jgi:SAM-dependent methyltransferase